MSKNRFPKNPPKVSDRAGKPAWARKNRLISKIVLGGMILIFLITSLVSAQEDEFIKSLNLNNADIRSVFNLLADYGKVNIVTAPSVTGQVTLSLKEVTWQQALDIVLQTYGLTGVREKEYIRVLPTKEYMEEQTRVEQHKKEKTALVSLKTEVINIRHATAKELIKPVKSILSDRGSVDTDDRTNSLIIRDVPESIQKVKQMVADLDRETDQIKISAQLLEIQSGVLVELGVNWTIFSDALDDGGMSEMTITQNADRVTDPVGNFTFSTLQTDFDLDATVSALASTNKAKVIAHPEITTLDNKEAYIQMGQKIPIKQFDESGNVIITFEHVGTILRVTPHVTSENRILMQLEPERSSYHFDANGVVINTSNARTNVVVDNGQTAVIGGLTSQEEQKIRTGIPILKDIPLLGYLFSYTKRTIDDRDLVIFITPTLVTQKMHSMRGEELE